MARLLGFAALLVASHAALAAAARPAAHRPRAATAAAAVAAAPAANWTLVPVQQAVLDLDLPAEQRWNDICAAFKSSGPLVEAYAVSALSSFSAAELEVVEGVASAMKKGLLGKEAADEMAGCARAMGFPDAGLLTLLNLSLMLRRLGGGPHNTTGPLPEGLTRGGGIACTSVVADGGDGSSCPTVHGRNLDWDLPNDLRNLTLAIDFQRGGQTLFTSIGPAGFYGVLTGYKAGAFAVSVNERDLGGDPIEDLAKLLLLGKPDPTHALRDAMLSAASYDEALQTLSTVKLAAPVYYTISGAARGQGAVLTRERDTSVEPMTLTTGGSYNRSWYALQTNYDHFVAAPAYDDRRRFGLRHMDEMGAQSGDVATLDSMLDVITAWPTRNDGTLMQAVMCPASGEFRAYAAYFSGSAPTL